MDRILRQQKAERQAEDSRRKPENVSLVSRPPSVAAGPSTSRHPQQNLESSASNINQRPPSANGSLHMFKRQVGSSVQPAHPPQVTSTNRPIAQRPTHSSAGVTPLSNIGRSKSLCTFAGFEIVFLASNIDMAIMACRPESGNLLRNREEMRQVKESLDEGYCDISGRAEDLNRIGR